MSLWHSLQNLGIRSDTPPFEVRNTRLVIYICLTSVATTAFYGTLFLCLGNGLSAAINFGIATFFLTPLLLLRQHRTAWSKALLILGINGGTLLAIMVYGHPSSWSSAMLGMCSSHSARARLLHLPALLRVVHPVKVMPGWRQTLRSSARSMCSA